ncbi:hypothetical protein [Streptomyces sp. bgisy084]|uniref:hypothetical protein n=1 Tax=unclassified Streptomyces TaxID=2593676 RepID=UPI003D7457A4
MHTTVGIIGGGPGSSVTAGRTRSSTARRSSGYPAATSRNASVSLESLYLPGKATFTLFIALFEEDYDEPLGFQQEYARRLAHATMPYPDITV